MRICKIVDAFLTDQIVTLAPSTLNWYANYLATFRIHVAGLDAHKLTNSIVYAWLAKFYGKQSPSSQHAAARCVVRLMNWAEAEQLIDVSPLRHFRKPPPSRRETIVTPTQYAACVRSSRGVMRDVIKFLWHTGCRPQELRAIEGAWIHGRKIVFPQIHWANKVKKRRRVIYMDYMAAALIAKLSAGQQGPLFRGHAGKPYTKNALALAMRRLRGRVEIEGLTAYSFRHAFITRLLERGVDVATVAALAGNSPRVILSHYEHVAVNELRLLQQLG